MARILIAVSGGLDSMVLLDVLRRLAVPWRWRLKVAHLNHHLRGRSSDADERWVRKTARQLGLPCEVGQAQVGRQAGADGVSVEMAARAARHAFLARVARRGRFDAIALAHHADDQVELFFLRLLRGAGSAGLAGMKWKNPSPAHPAIPLVRPLLDCTRADLESYAREMKIHCRVDASNASLDILRNRVRHELLPLLGRHYQPALRPVILREMRVLGAEAALVDDLARSWRQNRRATAFAALAVALQRKVLHQALLEIEVEPDFERLEFLRLQPGVALMVRPGLSLAQDGAGRIIAQRNAPEPFDAGRMLVSLGQARAAGQFAGLAWSCEITRHARAQPSFGAGWEWFDADRIGREIILRHWQPGDRFQPSGMASAVKLQDLFTNAGISRHDRVHLVVATTLEGRIWWVEGLRIAEPFKLGPATRRRLKWSWCRPADPPARRGGRAANYKLG